MLFHRLHEDLDTREPDRLEPVRERDGGFRGDASGAAIRDQALGVDSAEVAPRRHVARAELELDSQRFEHAAPDLILQRVVAKQTQVAGSTARRDAGRDVADQTAGRPGRQGVKVRQSRCFHLRAAGIRMRKTGETVEGHQDDLRRVGDDERRDELEHEVRRPSPGFPGRPDR